MSSPIRRLLAVLLVSGGGCAGFDLNELPPQPLVFVYRTPEEARTRAELLANAKPQERSRSAASDAAILDVDDFLDYLAGENPAQLLDQTYGRVALLDPRSGRVTRIEAAGRGSRPLQWSRDHRRLLFTATRAGRPQLFEYDLETEELRARTHGRDAHAFGSYGPGGPIAFSAVRGRGTSAQSRIYVTEPGGRPPRAVSPGPADFDPVWSPDGRTIVFTRTLGRGDLVLAAVDPEGSAPPRAIGRGRDPVFTPDGKWLVFSAAVRGGWRLWRMRPDGSAKVPIGDSSWDELHPAVSPDGRFVAYVSREGDHEVLRIRRFDGSGDRPLLLVGDGTSPAW